MFDYEKVANLFIVALIMAFVAGAVWLIWIISHA